MAQGRAMAGLALALVAAGCNAPGTPSPGTGSTGTVLVATGSLSFGASEAAALTGTASCPSSGMAWAELVASDEADVCTLLQAAEERAGRLTIRILMVDTASAGAVAPGSFPVVYAPGTETTYATLAVVASSSACSLDAIPAYAGTVTVTSTAGGQLQGTVDALLIDEGSVQGAFAADLCAVASPGDACSGSFGPVAPTCVP
jgi:hypothetical protein